MAECLWSEGNRSRCPSLGRTVEIWRGVLLLALLISSMESEQDNEDDGLCPDCSSLQTRLLKP
jgi:hypothetical protein